MRRDGSDASRELTADGILQHLAEIGAGRCRITDDDLAAAPSDVSRELLVGLLTLYEDLKYERELRAVAEQHSDRLVADLRAAVTARDEFLSVASHELRTPLSALRLQSTLLSRWLAQVSLGEHEAELRMHCGVIERQVRRLEMLTRELLDVTRITTGRLELHRELVDLVPLAREVVARHAVEDSHDRSMIALECDASLTGRWDAFRLDQVISNLLANAAKYTPPGGDIAVRAKRVDDDVVLTVRDTGIGIAPDVLPRIFDLFVQDRQAVERSQGGLGIGLTIARSLIERHGGSVSVRSGGAGKGSEFSVRLPATGRTEDPADPVPAPPATLEPVTAMAAVARILVVDDNEDGAEMLAEALTGKGYDTRVAHDAPTALRIAAEFAPNVAFLDIGLPVMDGYELAVHLREIPGLATLRLVAVTGYGQASDRQRTREAGFHHHLVKPVDMDALDATLMRGSPRTD
jgi:signal transduction histidine kinase/ActR/RegA family two-component response regulator